MGKFELTLDSPITEEQWDILEDVDFEHTNSIEFHTKHGKTVRFMKVPRTPDEFEQYFNDIFTQFKKDIKAGKYD